jgi:hypothetical protein
VGGRRERDGCGWGGCRLCVVYSRIRGLPVPSLSDHEMGWLIDTPPENQTARFEQECVTGRVE